MKPFRTETGRVVPLVRADVDTDQIVPAAFLSRIDRTGYGEVLFHHWRTDEHGNPDPSFALNDPRYRGATVLVAGPNFGCGSSREHAAWALVDYGFRVVVAPSFADIFRSNCYQNGLLPVVVDRAVVDTLAARAGERDGYAVTIDLEHRRLSDAHGLDVGFEIDAFRRDCLLNGWDDIDLTLERLPEIEAYERRHPTAEVT